MRPETKGCLTWAAAILLAVAFVGGLHLAGFSWAEIVEASP